MCVIYEQIEVYNPNIARKILIVFGDIIAVCLAMRNFNK